MKKLELFWPIKRPFVIGQGFGECLPSVCEQYHQWGLLGHNGLDIPILHGAPVYASHDGIIAYAGADVNEGYGVVIRTTEAFLDTENQPKMWKTIYWHLLPDIPARVGQKVMIGDVIGYVDNTGFSKGDHLHFGLKPIAKGENDWTWSNTEQNNGYQGAVDPMPYMSTMTAYELRTTLQVLSEQIRLIGELISLWIKRK